ncbi:MAG: hypothetical protein ACLSHC_07930 [Bilophila wadsworthia]
MMRMTRYQIDVRDKFGTASRISAFRREDGQVLLSVEGHDPRRAFAVASAPRKARHIVQIHLVLIRFRATRFGMKRLRGIRRPYDQGLDKPDQRRP